jgi:4-aminobutyrate aminotransferase-like enzyme
MIGIEIMDSHGAPAASVALTAVQKLLERGFIFLPEGEWGEVISLTPPLTISWRQLKRALDAVLQVLQELTESNPAMVAGREGISST